MEGMSSTVSGAPYQDASLTVEQRVADLLARMTLEEKAAQMMCVWQQKATTLVDSLGEFDPDKARASFGTETVSDRSAGRATRAAGERRASRPTSPTPFRSSFSRKAASAFR